MTIDFATLLHVLGVTVVMAPAILFGILGLSSLLDHALGERLIARLTFVAVVTGLCASVAVLALMLILGTRSVPIELGNWVALEHADAHFHFSVKFVFDRLSVPFTILSFLLCGTISSFANVYMHKEPGYNRFFVLYAMFLLGMVVSALAGTIETLFAGWELVGLSSALLVAFFHDRPGPVRNGLHVWAVYRIADAAFLMAAVVLHHMTGEGDFSGLMGTGAWPDRHAVLTSSQALQVGLLLIVAVAGKSALIPFSGWLPRAMEGPTPSSAIFYGALSVHLGAFLLLRVSPILELSSVLTGLVIGLGLATALFGAVRGRVQTDIKGALSFACLTQIGIIVAEIGCGFRYLALVHMIGHACLRTLQFLRASSVLRDYHTLENAIGARLPRRVGTDALPARLRSRVYRFALERGYLDAWLVDYVVRPVRRSFLWTDSLERKWTDSLTGIKPSRESDLVAAHSPLAEEVI